MSVQLSQLVSVKGRFHRSVSLTRDWAGSRDLSEYVVTDAVTGIADQILSELRQDGGSRAWSLTGPYGTGKSAFALFLTDLLATKSPRHEAGRALRAAHLKRTPPMLPVLVQAERGPLLPLLLSAIRNATQDSIRQVATKARRMLKEGTRSGEEVANLITELADAAKAKGLGGVVIVVDEFGKFLEFAAANRGSEDVFVLQQLAEAVSRTEVPVLLLTVLHTGFADYFAQADEVGRAEWQKVQGRFRDLPFHLPTDQLLSLVGHALEAKFANGIDAAYQRRTRRLLKAPELKEALARGKTKALVPDCLPLHPVTSLVLWPLFRSKVAQNERSLFSFLTSHEPYGLQDFLSHGEASKNSAPLYGLERLYDYVANALGLGAHTGTDSRKWALMEHALDRVPADAPQVTPKLVKAIGILSVYGNAVGLKTNEAMLKLALDEEEGFEEALDLLKTESIVLHRRHTDSYGLWEGSDIDLEGTFEEAREHLAGGSLCERLSRRVELRPYVARAHYVKSGTLRFFEGEIVSSKPAEIEEALKRPSRADGRVFFVLEGEGQSPDAAKNISRTLSQEELILVAAPRFAGALALALEQLECWQWVLDHTPEIQGDSVARQEVQARVERSRADFEAEAGKILGLTGHTLDPGCSDWYYRGKQKQVEGARGFQSLLSELCGQRFDQTPVLHNELLNRHNLSSAAARARRNLIERMLQHTAEENLGIEGFPPEYSMYKAVLAEAGFHRRGKSWAMRAPDAESWRPVWEAVEEFIAQTVGERRPICELIAKLKAPPIGLRDGPIPVVITAALLIKGRELALYEDDLFVPELNIEALERFLRRPETFEVQSYRLTGKQRAVLDALSKLMGGSASVASADRFLAVVKQLVRMVAQLPPYARQTRSGVSPEAAAVREALLSARDPKALVFEDLPAAVGVDLKGKSGPEEFAKALQQATLEMSRAYPKLLETVAQAIVSNFGLSRAGDQGRKDLAEKAAALVEHAGDPRVQVFIREAAKLDDRDWREVLARAANDGKPPTHWRDVDATGFSAKVQVIATEFDRLAELVAASGDSQTGSVMSIALLDKGRTERRLVISTDAEQEPRVAEFADQIREAAGRWGDAETRLAVLALVRVARELLDGLEHEGGLNGS